MSMLPFFAGLVLFVGGWQAMRWAWPAIVFLVFMLPLPGDVQASFSLTLQGISARMSVYVIQTLGIPATVSGHKIELTDRSLDVERACSGLRMMMMFFAMCVGAAFVVRKPVWEKLFIIASAAPIAVIANAMRIVVTAVGCEVARYYPSVLDADRVMEIVHEWAGYLIEMPAGMLLLWLELTLLAKLLISPLPERPLVMGGMLEERAPAADERNTRHKRQS
jgi:exosortase